MNKPRKGSFSGLEVAFKPLLFSARSAVRRTVNVTTPTPAPPTQEFPVKDAGRIALPAPVGDEFRPAEEKDALSHSSACPDQAGQRPSPVPRAKEAASDAPATSPAPVSVLSPQLLEAASL
ncbi:hypothetical protein R6Z07F_012828 [Ovis aries]